jgi:hypothetical protein
MIRELSKQKRDIEVSQDLDFCFFIILQTRKLIPITNSDLLFKIILAMINSKLPNNRILVLIFIPITPQSDYIKHKNKLIIKKY